MSGETPAPKLTRTQLTRFRSLHRRQKRREEGLFLVEGVKSIRELLQSDFTIETLIHLPAVNPDRLLQRPLEFPRFSLPARQFQQLCETVNPEGVLAVVRLPDATPVLSSDQPGVYLDGISDPGNLGTIIRTADWFGLAPLLLSHDTVDPFNGKVIRASMGSLFHLPPVMDDAEMTNLTALQQQGRELIGLTLDAEEELHQAALPSVPLLVLGSESGGIRPGLADRLDRTVRIAGAGRTESLNAAQALTIAAYQLQVVNRTAPGADA